MGSNQICTYIIFHFLYPSMYLNPVWFMELNSFPLRNLSPLGQLMSTGNKSLGEISPGNKSPGIKSPGIKSPGIKSPGNKSYQERVKVRNQKSMKFGPRKKVL